jgi:hypothetical protein
VVFGLDRHAKCWISSRIEASLFLRDMLWVTAQELDQWAATLPAKSALPEMLRGLVYATVPPEHLKNIDFKVGSEVSRPGYDGTTMATPGTAFVPEGICFWEIGNEVGNTKGKE